MRNRTTYYPVTVKFDSENRCVTCGSVGIENSPMDMVCPECPPESLSDIAKAMRDYEPNRLVQLASDFADEMADKMVRSYFDKHRTGWDDPDWTIEDITRDLVAHIKKGDPVDIAIYAAFIWYRQSQKEMNQ